MAASDGGLGLLDTSVFIAEEVGREIGRLPEYAAISVVTIAELRLGVLMSSDPEVSARRLRTLTGVLQRFVPVPIDGAVAERFAEIAAVARRQGRRPQIMDSWIAATAVALDCPVYTQDEGFEAIPYVRVVRV